MENEAPKKKQRRPTTAPRSEEQRKASRANGAKSRGPRTAAGRQRSKWNALIHGAHSAEILLPNEDEDQYAALRTAVWSHYQPQDAMEEEMAEQIFTALWKRRRYQAMQQALWKSSMLGALQESLNPNPSESSETTKASETSETATSNEPTKPNEPNTPNAEHLLNEANQWCRRQGNSLEALDALENRARMAFVRAQRNWHRNKKEESATQAKEDLAAQTLDAISQADFARLQSEPQPKPNRAA